MELDVYLSEALHSLMDEAARGPFVSITQTVLLGICACLLTERKNWNTGGVSLELWVIYVVYTVFSARCNNTYNHCTYIIINENFIHYTVCSRIHPLNKLHF